MNRIVAALLICTVFCIAACQKHDDCPEPPKEEATCTLMQSLVSENSGNSAISQYRKEYDPATGKVSKVVAALYGLLLEDSVALLVRYQGNTVYFIAEKNAADTVLVATFDAANRLTRMALGNVTPDDYHYLLEPATDFGYNAGRLSVITRHMDADQDFVIYAAYDANGNIVRFYETDDDANTGTFFTYDLSVKASAQFYSDHYGTDFWSNQVYLAQFMGWLPDLNPVNRRTSFRQVFADEDTTDDVPGYVFNDTELTDHVYDSDGKLLSYKIAEGQITYTNVWNCDARKTPN